MLGRLPRVPDTLGQLAPRHRRRRPDRGTLNPIGQQGQPVRLRSVSAPTSTTSDASSSAENTGSCACAAASAATSTAAARCSALPRTASSPDRCGREPVAQCGDDLAPRRPPPRPAGVAGGRCAARRWRCPGRGTARVRRVSSSATALTTCRSAGGNGPGRPTARKPRVRAPVPSDCSSTVSSGWVSAAAAGGRAPRSRSSRRRQIPGATACARWGRLQRCARRVDQQGPAAEVLGQPVQDGPRCSGGDRRTRQLLLDRRRPGHRRVLLRGEGAGDRPRERDERRLPRNLEHRPCRARPPRPRGRPAPSGMPSPVP